MVPPDARDADVDRQRCACGVGVTFTPGQDAAMVTDDCRPLPMASGVYTQGINSPAARAGRRCGRGPMDTAISRSLSEQDEPGKLSHGYESDLVFDRRA
jgi:hypothetical protein